MTEHTPTTPEGGDSPVTTEPPEGDAPAGGTGGPQGPGAPPPGGHQGEHPGEPGRPQGAAPGRALLRRSRGDRVVAGVAGGLGRWANVDPVLFRVGFAVLTVFGGAGLLLYAILWLVVPEEGTDVSEGQGLVHGSPSVGVVPAVLATVAGIVLVGLLMGGATHATPALLVGLLVIVVVALSRRDQGRSGGQSGFPPGQPPPTGPGGGDAPARPYDPGTPQASSPPHTAPAAPPPPYGGVPAGTATEDPTEPVDTFGPPAPGAYPGAEYATSPYGPGGFGTGPYAAPPSAAPPAPPRARRYPVLTPLTLSVAAVVAGALVALDLAGLVDVPTVVVLGSALAVVAAGLLAGTFYGRGRGLVGVGVVLSMAVALASTAPGVPVGSGTGDRTWAPASVSALHHPYELGAGDATLDLTRLDPAGGSVPVNVRLGAGDLTVLVPPDADVHVDARASLGSVRLPGGEHNGVSVHRTVTDTADVLPSRGTLDLDLRLGVGSMEVRRAAS